MRDKVTVIVEYKIETGSSTIAKAIQVALLPDISQIPGECSCKLEVQQDILTIILNCSNISKLRALNNSFIGVVTMMLEVLEVLAH
ncbi:MAG: KEOPS complex subunit Pcc1 [Desulfurococcaceae archaeon]